MSPASSARKTQPPGADERWYRAIIEHSNDLIVVVNPDGSRKFVSPSVTRMLGYSMEGYLNFGSFELIHPDDLGHVRAGHADCVAHDGPQHPFRYRVRHADGSWRTFEGTRSNLLNDPIVQGIVITTRDVTDAERSRRRLFASEAEFRSAFTFAAIGMALVGLDGRLLEVNRALCALTGFRRDELLARTFQEITHPDDLAADLSLVADLIAGRKETYQLEKRYFRKDGSTVWVLLSVSLVRDEMGQPHHFISQIQDINRRRELEAQLRWLALHDSLTGLANRAHLSDQLELLLATDEAIAVLFLDLDGFKRVNDTFGHTAGDYLLVTVAARLSELTPENAIVARIGGDEFVVALRAADAGLANLVAAEIVSALSEPIRLEDREATVQASVGIALRSQGMNVRDLLHQADQALYAAKRSGGGRIIEFSLA